ncbi:MAG: hypothetical protein GX893_07820 [Firmicutes bacterium]|nr:hypothetical protein [Bacillota bacterium]
MSIIFGKKAKKKSINLALILFVLIFTLGAMGAGYAAWTQKFTVRANITTGQLQIKIRDAVLENSAGHESLSFTAHRDDGVVEKMEMNVETYSNPYQAVIVFTVENTGTVAAACRGLTKDAYPEITMEIMEAPDIIVPGATEQIKVKISGSYCYNLNFSAILQFEQALHAK